MTLTKTLIAGGASALILVSACAPLQDPNNPNRRTQTGALAGAATGALIGIARGDDADERRRGALVGAAIGAGGGALIGNILDRQEAELRQQLGNNVGITNTGDQLIVTMPQDILFDVDSATLTGSLQNDLRTLAASLNRYPNSTVNVIGHTDSDGEAAYNQALSQRRAQAVSSVLINSGVAANRLNSVGRGEDQPIATNYTPEGKRQNRRVEIVITPTA